MLGEKALDCLELTSLPILSAERGALLEQLADRYSPKAVISKLEQLADKGLIEYGISPLFGWLTEAGAAALAARG